MRHSHCQPKPVSLKSRLLEILAGLPLTERILVVEELREVLKALRESKKSQIGGFHLKTLGLRARSKN